MDLEQFIDKFAEQFEITERDEFIPETQYRNLDEWDSLLALSIIGMVKNTYGVKITGEEVKNAGTIQALFNLQF